MKRILSKAALLLFLSSPAFAQGSGAQCCISDDYDFLEYLLGNSLERDAATLLSEAGYRQSDTLEFMKGWTAYSMKELGGAALHFGNIPAESPFFDKAVFFGAVCEAHSGNLSGAGVFLDAWAPRYSSASTLLKDTYILERCGLALLDGDIPGYGNWASLQSGTSGPLLESFDKLDALCGTLYSRPAKKQWVAALASTVLPGAGQFYAGDRTAGVLTLLLEGAFAIIAAEQCRHYTLNDWRALTWAGAALTIHAFNIYGATVSVSIKNEELAEHRSTAVLYNIHIPLRRVFR